MCEAEEKLQVWAVAAELQHLRGTALPEEEWAPHMGRCRPFHVKWKAEEEALQQETTGTTKHLLWWSALAHRLREMDQGRKAYLGPNRLQKAYFQDSAGEIWEGNASHSG